MSTAPINLFSSTATADSVHDWTQSWANAEDSWKNDPQGLLTNQKLYEEEMRRYNAGRPGFLNTLGLPFFSNVMPVASPYVVGLYRSSMLEMIQRDPTLMNEFLNRVGGPVVLSQAALYAKNNPAIAYGASSGAELNDVRRRKDLIFSDLAMWVKELAARQNYRAPPIFRNTPTLGSSLVTGPTRVLAGQVSTTTMTMVPLLFLLLIVGGTIWYFKK